MVRCKGIRRAVIASLTAVLLTLILAATAFTVIINADFAPRAESYAVCEVYEDGNPVQEIKTAKATVISLKTALTDDEAAASSLQSNTDNDKSNTVIYISIGLIVLGVALIALTIIIFVLIKRAGKKPDEDISDDDGFYDNADKNEQ